MKSKIDSSHIFVLIGSCLLLVAILFTQKDYIQKEARLVLSLIGTKSMLAQVTSPSSNVEHFSSCPSTNNLYTEMLRQFGARIADNTTSIPSDATTDVNRNPAFLRTWFTGSTGGGGLDLTGRSDSSNGYVLISPRHAVTAWHLLGNGLDIGKTATFVNKAGTSFTKTIVGIKQVATPVNQYGTDIAVVVFDSDVDVNNSIPYYPLLSNSDLLSRIPGKAPVMFFDKFGDYLIRSIEILSSGMGNIHAFPPSSLFYPYGLESQTLVLPNSLITTSYAGDSGHPSFYIINNKLVLASVASIGSQGTTLGAYIPQINQAMTELDQSFPDLTHYQVTTMDMSCFPPQSFSQTTIQAQSFSVNDAAPVDTVVGRVIYNRTNNILSTNSFTISSGNTGGAFAIDSTGQIKVANSSAVNHQTNPTFTLGITMKEEYPAPDNSTVDDTGIVTINVPAGSTPPPNNPPVNPPPSADTTLPVVTAFVIPSTSTSLTIPITTFTATDNVGVVGYKITEIAMKPSIDPNTVNVASVYNANQLLSSGWTASAPTTYTFGSIGSKTLYAWAIDSAGNVSNSVSRSITVTSPPLPNSAPVLAAIGNKTVNENSAISFVVSATDTNNDILTYSVSGLPSGAVFNSSTKTFSWTPSYTQSGIYTVIFSVADLGGLIDSRTITITVSNIGRAPIANAGIDQSVILQGTPGLSASGSSDPDGGTLTYRWTKISGPGSVTFSNSSSLFTDVTFGTEGTYVFQVLVSNGTLYSTDTISVTVSLVPVSSFSIVSQSGSNGTISPFGTNSVSAGNNKSFSFSSASGYRVASITIDGTSISYTNDSFTFSNVSANHTISVSFTKKTVPPTVPNNLNQNPPPLVNPSSVITPTPISTNPPPNVPSLVPVVNQNNSLATRTIIPVVETEQNNTNNDLILTSTTIAAPIPESTKGFIQFMWSYVTSTVSSVLSFFRNLF